MGCSEQLLRAGGCFLSTSCVPEAAPSTRGGLRGPGGADRERAPPNQRICSFRLPRAPWPSRQRQSGLPGCWAVGTPPPFPRRPGHLMGVSAVSERFHSLSKVTQGVRGGKGRTRGHGPGTHGPQGARPGCRQETGWEGRGLAPSEADGHTAHLSFGGSPSPPWWAAWPAGPDPGPAWLPALADTPTKGLEAPGGLRGSERTPAVEGLPFSVLMNGCRALKPQHGSLLPGPVGESRALAFRRPWLPAPGTLPSCRPAPPRAWAPWQR